MIVQFRGEMEWLIAEHLRFQQGERVALLLRCDNLCWRLGILVAFMTSGSADPADKSSDSHCRLINSHHRETSPVGR